MRPLLVEQTAGNAWIIEGVYGELVEAGIDRLDVLIWLAHAWPACRAGLLARGSSNVNMHHLSPEKQAESFTQLLAYAEAYEHRTNSRSHQAHSQLLQSFPGTTIRLNNRPTAFHP